MNDMKCRVAIVGAGYMAQEHVRAFLDIENVRVIGIHSRTRQRAQKLADQYGIPAVCDSVPELYDVTRADLVVVTVPELMKNAVSSRCFEYPWAVLLEKPVGYNLSDAEEIESAALERNCRVFVALNRRQYASTQTALNDLRDLPGSRFIRVQDQEDQVRALQDGHPRIVVENWMYANSVHVIDYFRIFGRGEIYAVEPVIPWKAGISHLVVAKVSFDSGDVGLYEGVWNGPGPWAVSIDTPDKRWEMRPLEQAGYQLAGQRKIKIIESHPWDSQFKPGLRLQAEKAVAAAMGYETDLPTLQDAMQTMHLVQAIFNL